VSISLLSHHYPDTDTGFGFVNPTFVGSSVQPLYKQTSCRLTLLHSCDLSVHTSQTAAPTSCKCTSASPKLHQLSQEQDNHQYEHDDH
jgi:hypothetical protein